MNAAFERAIATESQRLIEEAETQEDAQRRSKVANVATTFVALLFALGPSLPGASHAFGAVTRGQAIEIAAIAWVVYEVRVLVHATLGAKGTVGRAIAAGDELCRYGVPLALIYASGSAASPFWVLTMGKSFAFPASTTERAKLDLGLFVASHATMMAALTISGRLADASFTGLVVLGVLTLQTMTIRSLATKFQVRAQRNVLERRLFETKAREERDRMARELHDGIGADVTALLLRLREQATGPNQPATAFAERAQAILDELRSVVWSLRNEQGTLAELGKLLDATCRSVRGSAVYERVTNSAQNHDVVGPRAALTTLTAARELVRVLAKAGATAVRVSLQVDGVLCLSVEPRGSAFDANALDESGGTFAEAQRLIGRSGGTLTLAPAASNANEAAIVLRAAIPLDELAT